MALDIQVLATSDNPLKADKTFTNIGSAISCDIYDITDIVLPVFTVDFNSAYRNATHLKTQLLDVKGQYTYYYITRVEEKSATSQILHCRLDERTTYSQEIRESLGNIVRNDLGSPTHVVDDLIPFSKRFTTQVIHFDSKSLLESEAELNVLLISM